MTDIADIQSLAVPANTVTNVTLVQPHADNATVGTAVESINNTNADGVIPVILGEDIDIVSASGDDDGAPVGTGALTVKLTYLDASFNQTSETVTLNGTTEVEFTDQNIAFVQKAEIVTTGTGLASAGAITIADVTGGGVHAVIDAGSKESGNCQWMVPAGHTGYIHGFWASIDDHATGTGTGMVHLQIAHAGFSGVANSETWRIIATMSLLENDDDVVGATGGNSSAVGSFSFPGNVPFVVPAKTMVRLAAIGGSTAFACTAGFSMSIQGAGAGTTVTES